MRTLTRIAITAICAIALVAASYGRAWSLGDPGPGPEVWGWCVLAATLLAIAGVFLVDRWWALLPALAPIAVTYYLHYLTDYVYPWESESIRPDAPVSFAVLLVLAIALHAAVLSIGFLPRRVWGLGKRMRLSTTTPRGMNR